MRVIDLIRIQKDFLNCLGTLTMNTCLLCICDPWLSLNGYHLCNCWHMISFKYFLWFQQPFSYVKNFIQNSIESNYHILWILSTVYWHWIRLVLFLGHRIICNSSMLNTKSFWNNNFIYSALEKSVKMINNFKRRFIAIWVVQFCR